MVSEAEKDTWKGKRYKEMLHFFYHLYFHCKPKHKKERISLTCGVGVGEINKDAALPQGGRDENNII